MVRVAASAFLGGVAATVAYGVTGRSSHRSPPLFIAVQDAEFDCFDL